MIFISVSFIIAAFFAMNMGASGAAASMGIAYGTGAIKKRKIALIICGIGIFLGAVFGGAQVTKTVGEEIIPTSIITIEVAMIILAAAAISLYVANALGIPLSTSEVTVGAIVGVGLAFQSVYLYKITEILLFWITIPVTAFLLTFLFRKLALKFERYLFRLKKAKWAKWMTVLLILTGFLQAFAAGMNNVSNAIGPLVGASLISLSTGTLIGGIFIAIGALLLGGKVVETNGKKITDLSLSQGVLVSGTGAGLVIIASLFGIPIPITQITTAGILGVGASRQGNKLWQKGIIKRMLMVWLVSPVFSLVISYGMVIVFLKGDIYNLIVITSVFIATVGSITLIKIVRLEKVQIIDRKQVQAKKAEDKKNVGGVL